ncbi:MAG: Jag N-terminal domain-containing protein [Actinobacteria bacterium]|nr:Jag N-terminal domain-containing protein [Actinomycetota bacterium]
MEEIRRTAPSVEEAVEAALAELGVSEQDAEVEVVEEPRQGVFGVGAHDATVIVRVRAPREELAEDELDEQGEIAADFVDGVLERMGISATVEPNVDEGTMYVDVIGTEEDDEDMGLLIGRHGQTLEALQELTRAVIGQRMGTRSRVVVDVEDYRKRQIDRLRERIREVAERVARTGQPEGLEPMNPFLRKVVHDTVGEVPGATSASEGVGLDRAVVIRPRS